MDPSKAPLKVRQASVEAYAYQQLMRLKASGEKYLMVKIPYWPMEPK